MNLKTKEEKNQNRNLWILAIIGIIVAIVLGILIVKNPKFFEEYGGILSLISLIVAILTFFYQQEMDEKKAREELHDQIRRFCATLQNDTKHIREDITGQQFEKVKSKKGNISTTVFFSTKIYDSLIFSGLVTQFLPETQSNLDNLYYKLERNNDNIRRRTDVIISRDSIPNTVDTKIPEVIDNFHELIGDYQKEILALLDKVEQNIQVELGRL